MTLKQKKIAVAKDVIAQIKLNKFVPVTGTYVDATFIDGDATGDLQKLIRGGSWHIQSVNRRRYRVA